MNEEIYAKGLDTLGDTVGILEDVSSLSWNPLSWLKLAGQAIKVVKGVETISKSQNGLPTFDGETKLQLAVDYLNKHINIPLLNETLEAELFEFLIRFIVLCFNELVGKNWFDISKTG